jgi:hypothetical protein
MSQEPQDSWQRRPNGSIDAHPIVGWDAACVMTAGLLRIRYARTPDEFAPQAPAIQFALTADQANTLIADLSEMVRRIESASGAGRA